MEDEIKYRSRLLHVWVSKLINKLLCHHSFKHSPSKWNIIKMIIVFIVSHSYIKAPTTQIIVNEFYIVILTHATNFSWSIQRRLLWMKLWYIGVLRCNIWEGENEWIFELCECDKNKIMGERYRNKIGWKKGNFSNFFFKKNPSY